MTLQIYSFKTRNPFFAKTSKRLLLLALSVVFIPSLLLCYIQEDYGKLVIESDRAKVEESKYTSKLILRWKGGMVTDRNKLNEINSVVGKRLERAGRSNCFVTSDFDRKSAYTAIVTTKPNGFDASRIHFLIRDAVTPTLKLRSSYSQTPFSLDNDLDEIVSVRSVHPGQERMTLAGYPDAPTGYLRMPWLDGFVYVSTSFHINDSHISYAERYNDGILLTMTPEGLELMQRMAYSLSQLQMQVAVLYKGKIRGVFDPQICVSDQLVIADLPENPQQIDLDADLLSVPKGFLDIEATEFGYSYPDIHGKFIFPHSVYKALASDSYDKLWIALYALLLVTVSGSLWYLHIRTLPKTKIDQY